MTAIQDAIRRLTADQPVEGPLAAEAAREILAGEATPAQIGAFLVALRIRGETAEHLAAFARTMRSFAMPVVLADREELVDTCGCGGDASGTFNISTAAALIAAGAGARVAKHGNRAVTSSAGSGSADVLAALGVKIDCDAATSAACLMQCGFAFFFAPAYHGAMKHAGPARREIGVRSILNLLGPLANPAGAKRQLIGVPAPHLTEVFAQVLKELGAERAMIVHGGDGLDELTLTGSSIVTELNGGKIRTYEFDPAEFGMDYCGKEELTAPEGADGRAGIIREILNGKQGGRRNIAELNAAAALLVAGLAEDWQAALILAKGSIDSGKARRTLDKLAEVSNR